MFNSQLKDYVRTYKGFYDSAFCKKVVEELSLVNWNIHSFYDSKTNTSKSFENELSVSWDIVPSKKQLDEKVWHVISQYILTDMAHMKSWFSQWTGYSLCRFNRYVPETQMKIHCDHIHSLFDGQQKGVPILTILGSLNSDYEGGELVLCGEKIELQEGDVVVFPSNFLYPHEVKPVKSGIRHSFVSWAW
jgi:predicted 2-oxoglutarate/Fe(II)-dependent dioxygenase YbiX